MREFHFIKDQSLVAQKNLLNAKQRQKSWRESFGHFQSNPQVALSQSAVEISDGTCFQLASSFGKNWELLW